MSKIIENGVSRDLTAEETAVKYAANTDLDTPRWLQQRIAAYAPLAEQLDMQFHDLQNDTTTWADHIAQIKALYPKV